MALLCVTVCVGVLVCVLCVCIVCVCVLFIGGVLRCPATTPHSGEKATGHLPLPGLPGLLGSVTPQVGTCMDQALPAVASRLAFWAIHLATFAISVLRATTTEACMPT